MNNAPTDLQLYMESALLRGSLNAGLTLNHPEVATISGSRIVVESGQVMRQILITSSKLRAPLRSRDGSTAAGPSVLRAADDGIRRR